MRLHLLNIYLIAASVALAIGCNSKPASREQSPGAKIAPLATAAGSATPKIVPSGCRGFDIPPPLVIINWDLGSGGAKSRRDSTSATAILRNNTKEDLEIDLFALYYVDGLFAKQNLVTLLLAPEERRNVEIDLRPTAKTSLAGLRFSGQVSLEAKAKTYLGGLRTTFSDDLFFHQEGRDLITYNEATLKKTFGGGDFRGSLTTTGEVENEKEIPRVAVGRLVSDDELKQMRLSAGPPRPQGTF